MEYSARQAAILKSFAASVIDLVKEPGSPTGLLEWSVPEDMNLSKAPGKDDGQGGILGAEAGQWGFPLHPTFPNVQQKVKILDLKWTLTDPAPASAFVSYKTMASVAKVYLDVGFSGWVGEDAVAVNGSGGFWVPAPSSTALIGLAGLIGSRRHRRG